MNKQLPCNEAYNPRGSSDNEPQGLVYRVRFRDVTVECDTLDEVDAVIQRFMDQWPALVADGGSKSSGGDAPDEWRELLQALTGLRQAGDRGISSSDLAVWAGLVSPKALAGKSRRWSRLLSELDLDIESVMVHQLVGRGTKRWFAGKDLKTAIRLVSRRTHIEVLPGK